ncbi:MAG: flagellar basal body rod protein FlgB [Zetaproteobacteria bacterium]|nr:flagellar basal body rod protein FlgB [Pseudobdellovibrionaceae bacterium]
MNNLIGGFYTHHERVQMESLNQRLTRAKVISGNVANAETPGFRAIGYDFEEQLQAVSGNDDPFPMKASNDKHFLNGHTEADGTVLPDVYIRPTESVGQDGNTVDVDKEMSRLSQNQLLYRASIEILNRRIGTLKYAISAGSR